MGDKGTSPLRAVQWSHWGGLRLSERRGLCLLDQGAGFQRCSWLQVVLLGIEDADQSCVPGARDDLPLIPSPSDTRVHTCTCRHRGLPAPGPGLEL